MWSAPDFLVGGRMIMRFALKSLKLFTLPALALAVLASSAQAQHYKQTNLISDLPGMAAQQDPNFKNPWGLTRSPTGSPWWVNNNNSGTSSLDTGAGAPVNIFTEASGAPGNFVVVPPPGFAPAGTTSTPTGIIFNGSATDFLLNKGTPTGKNAVFIFVTEDGTISGWNPGVNITAGGKAPSTNGVLEVDNSDKGSPRGAVYKGATSGEVGGQKYLYVTNFRKGRVEVYDSSFSPVHFGEEAFDADHLPRGFAPFNIQNIGGILFVTYARQDAAKHDDVAGDGSGFVELYTPTGRHIGHLEHGDWFNSPWGVVWTTRDFGEFSNAILVGNFGSGKIAAFNGFTFKFMGFLKNADGTDMAIDGLWSLTFGNDGTAGTANTLFFAAGINGEQDGLFGTITPIDGLDGDEE
jgi:uncharacterized protein (TIGR03118 family)